MLASGWRVRGLLKIDLRGNNLGPASAKLLAEALITSIVQCAVVATRALFLGRNRLRDEGVAALLPAVAASAVATLDLAVRVLDLGGCICIGSRSNRSMLTPTGSEVRRTSLASSRAGDWSTK